MAVFFVPGIPATKGSWKVMRGKLRPDNNREKPWALSVAWSAKAARVAVAAGPVAVELSCYFPRPKKPTNPFPSRNDVDKLARSCLDALTGIAWADDQQVVELVVSKAYTSEMHPDAGAWVSVRTVREAGSSEGSSGGPSKSSKPITERSPFVRESDDGAEGIGTESAGGR
jgi:crossover junction endodeoxyribonuclease RusA